MRQSKAQRKSSSLAVAYAPILPFAPSPFFFALPQPVSAAVLLLASLNFVVLPSAAFARQFAVAVVPCIDV